MVYRKHKSGKGGKDNSDDKPLRTYRTTEIGELIDLVEDPAVITKGDSLTEEAHAPILCGDTKSSFNGLIATDPVHVTYLVAGNKTAGVKADGRTAFSDH